MNKIIALSLFVLFLPFAAAQEGCFLYKSSLYCSTISLETAQAECALFPDCSLSVAFQSGVCEDAQLFPQCQTALCKSSCQQTFRGLCDSGIIPAGGNTSWCVPGCCITKEKYCGYLSTQWNCQIEAENNNATYLFDFTLTENECDILCQEPMEQRELLAEEIAQFPLGEKNETLSVSGVTKRSFSFLLAIFLFMAMIAFITFIFYKMQQATKISRENLPKTSQEVSTSFLPFTPNPEAQARIRKLQQKHDSKLNRHMRELFLSAAGLGKPLGNTTFSELQKIARIQEARKFREKSPVYQLQKRTTQKQKKKVL